MSVTAEPLVPPRRPQRGRRALSAVLPPVLAFAVLFGGESTTTRMLFGGLMVLAAMLLVELAPRRKVEAEVLHPAQ